MTTNNQTANTTQAIDSQSQTAPTAQNTLTQSQQDLLAKQQKKEEKLKKRKKGWNYYADKSKTGFVGLSNQGATCYMNSLLQTLFMTPEFRLALYKWEYDEEKEGPKKDSIPYQLQKLFAKLQLSEMSSVETKGLTKSFGWDLKDAFEQHDIQELNRVLFDALEKSFRDTPSYDLVNELYQGTMADQIVCQNCNNKIVREDKFLDIPLVIRGVSSVEGALDKFVEDEVLDEDNKYFCEKCDKKCDAWKGLKLKELPYLLTLQLKRFDIDYDTFDRVKLHNPVSFPRYLNMDKYVNTNIHLSSTSTPLPDENENINNNNNNNSEENKENNAVIEDDDDEDEKRSDEKFLSYMIANMGSKGKEEEVDPSNLEPIDDSAPPSGDNIYELYSILIHSGTASAGHYFAYIKSFEDRKWYNFNDEMVSYLKKNEIENSFGGKKNSMWGGSTNAYMLVYRKVKPDINLAKISIEQLTEYHREKLLQFNTVFVEERKEDKRQRDKLTLKVVYDKSNHLFFIDKHATLETAKNEIIMLLDLDKLPEEEKIEMENIRIREYDSIRGIPSTIYSDLNSSLASLGIKNNYYLFVETRKNGEEWPKWNADDFVVRICFFNVEKNEPDPPMDLTLSRASTLLELKEQIISALDLSDVNLRVFTVGIRIEELKFESISLAKDYNICSGERIYVENNSGKMLDNGEEYSPSIEWIKQTKDTVKLKYNKLGTTVYEEVLTVQQFLSLIDLKEKLSEIIGLPVDRFKMKRKAAIMFELKDLNCNLAEAALSNNSMIHIEEGTPLERDQYSFKIMWYDEVESKFNLKFELPVYSSATWGEIAQIIGERLNLKADHIRLREKFGTSLAKIFKPQNTVKKSISYLNDGKEIVVQLLNEPENLSDDDVVLYLARFFPQENRVSTKEEMVIKKDVTLFDFREMIAQKSGIPNERLQFAKPFSIQTLLHIDAIKDLSWRKYLPKEQSSQKLTSMMWFISDGDLFVYKDQDEDPDDVKAKNNENNNNNHGPGNSSFVPSVNVVSRPRREEKALKIKTRFDKEDEKQYEEKREKEKKEKEEKEKVKEEKEKEEKEEKEKEEKEEKDEKESDTPSN